VAMIHRAARRYAEAAFALARQAQAEEAWARDLQRLAELLAIPVAEKALTSPAVPAAQKLAAIDAELPDLQPQVRNLVQILLHRDRLELLPEIAAAYRELLNRTRGIVTAQVTTAVPLSDEQRVLLAERLGDYVGRQVHLETSVDPSIMGGVVARIGDLLLDGSVRGRLEALRRRLMSDGRV